jgi:hypothetical protein
MGGTSEREYIQKIEKMRRKMSRKSGGVTKEFTKLEKTKVNLLKKNEENRQDIDRNLEKMKGKISGSKDLAPESKARLFAEIRSLQSEINQIYFDLKTRIAETVIPA